MKDIVSAMAEHSQELRKSLFSCHKQTMHSQVAHNFSLLFTFFVHIFVHIFCAEIFYMGGGGGQPHFLPMPILPKMENTGCHSGKI